MHKIFRAVFRRQIEDLISEYAEKREKYYLDENLRCLQENISLLEDVSCRERRDAKRRSVSSPVEHQDNLLICLKEDMCRLMKRYDDLVAPRDSSEDPEIGRRRRERIGSFHALFEESIRLLYRVNELSPLYGRTLSFIDGQIAFPRRKASVLKEAFEKRSGGKASIPGEGALVDAIREFEEKWHIEGDPDAMSREADQLVHQAERLYSLEDASS